MDKNTKLTPEKKPKESSVTAGDADNVDKIRDILFGNQMREFDRKFSLLEKDISSDLAAMRKENSLQIESLQTFIESEIGILAGKLSNTEKAHIEEMDKLESAMQQHVKQIEARIAKTGELLDNQSRDINQKILKQSQEFAADMTARMKDARERMDGHRQELSSAKVDKTTLSEMLSNLAMQINPDESSQD